MIAFSRPFWPLFLHVLGAMTLFGALLTAVITSWTAWGRPDHLVLRRATFWALVAAVPAYVVLRVAAQVVYSDEKDVFGGNDPAWVGIGFGVTDPGLLIFLAALACGYWWLRTGKPIAGRIVAAVSTLYLFALALAVLAMSGKWR